MLTRSFDDFAGDNNGRAEDEHVRYNNLFEDHGEVEAIRHSAEQARALNLEIERQIDANSGAGPLRALSPRTKLSLALFDKNPPPFQPPSPLRHDESI